MLGEQGSPAGETIPEEEARRQLLALQVREVAKTGRHFYEPKETNKNGFITRIQNIGHQRDLSGGIQARVYTCDRLTYFEGEQGTGSIDDFVEVVVTDEAGGHEKVLVALENLETGTRPRNLLLQGKGIYQIPKYKPGPWEQVIEASYGVQQSPAEK